MPNPTVLDDAYRATSGQRQDDYGKPEDSFQLIADYWTVHLRHFFHTDITILPKNVAKMLLLTKVAREEHKHKRDNLVDIAGYTRTLSMIEGDEGTVSDATEVVGPEPPPGSIIMTDRERSPFYGTSPPKEGI